MFTVERNKSLTPPKMRTYYVDVPLFIFSKSEKTVFFENA
jgi:hypothetical protein